MCSPVVATNYEVHCVPSFPLAVQTAGPFAWAPPLLPLMYACYHGPSSLKQTEIMCLSVCLSLSSPNPLAIRACRAYKLDTAWLRPPLVCPNEFWCGGDCSADSTFLI